MVTRRDWFAWHGWIGLTAGLLLFVVCWSGTVAVFSRDIDHLLNPALRAPVSAHTLPWAEAKAAIAAARPGWDILQINAPYAPGHLVEAWVEDPQAVMHRVYADPSTGEVTAVTPYFNVQRFFRSFHMALFITDWTIAGVPLGYWIVGLLAVALLVSMVSSLIFYRRWWRGFLKLEVRKGAKVFWSDAHKLAGLWSLWFLPLIGATGIWYLVEWYAPRTPPGPELPVSAASNGPPPDLSTMVATAEAAYPGFRVRAVSFSGGADGPVEFHGQDGSTLVRDRAARVWIDPRDGTVLNVRRVADLTPYQRWIETADPLHFGDFAGLWSKAVWFLFGLLLSGLTLTGAYLQAARQRRLRGGAIRAPVAVAYGVTVAVLLASAWMGAQEIQAYGTGGRWPVVPASTWAFILAWIAVTVGILTVWMRRLR